MSSSVIPGNENKVFEVVHNLHALGAEIIFNNDKNKLHVSGHSPSKDLENVIETLSPKVFVPVHGDIDMLNAHKNLAIKKNIDPTNVFVLSNGDNLEVSENGAKLLDQSKVIDEIVLRENYETRMIKNAGYCRAHGYGFHQKILNKYYLKDKNIISINFKDFPSPEGYFFSYQNDNLNDALILIGAEEEIVQRYLKEKYKIVYSEKDCYFIRK